MTKPHITLNLMDGRVYNGSFYQCKMHKKGMPGNPESHYDFYLEKGQRKRKSEK